MLTKLLYHPLPESQLPLEDVKFCPPVVSQDLKAEESGIGRDTLWEQEGNRTRHQTNARRKVLMATLTSLLKPRLAFQHDMTGWQRDTRQLPPDHSAHPHSPPPLGTYASLFWPSYLVIKYFKCSEKFRQWYKDSCVLIKQYMVVMVMVNFIVKYTKNKKIYTANTFVTKVCI